VKRLQDKEKLKDSDKMKLQIEQLIELTSRIIELQTYLQRELQHAKQEAREAVEARNTQAKEMSDLAETVEMATLDKEMAEEKVRLPLQFILLLIHDENNLVFIAICLNVDIF
jgi:dynactin 1